MTRKEFLDDMVAFYSADPVGRRSVSAPTANGLSCFYRGPEGRKCAIGRYIPDEEYSPELEGRGIRCAPADETGIPIPKSIEHLGWAFLNEVQGFHDNDENWSTKGLTRTGLVALNEIREEFNA